MISKNILLKIYKNFSLIRSSQVELIANYHPEDKMKCPIHFCLGQEALASVANLFLKEDDYALSHHRSHAYYLAKGCSLDAMVAEFYGKKTGANLGLAGSQELSMASKNFFSGTILSGMFAVSLGTAYKQKISNKNDISITIIGDGGMEEGIVYETLNLASLKSLPILFICENNNFSVHTNIKERTKVTNFKKLNDAFGIKYEKISDHRIEKIFPVVKKSFEYVRKKRKPMFLEFDTMRTCSHVGPESDDKEFNYRNKYLSNWEKRDSHKYLRNKIIKNFSLKIVNDIDEKNKIKVLSAIKKAKNSDFLSYQKSLDLNFIKSYSSIIKKFTENKFDLDSDQLETKLKNY
jgi:TPP-dependent pyruvate/acetoin dehydrogenase alpha subunit